MGDPSKKKNSKPTLESTTVRPYDSVAVKQSTSSTQESKKRKQLEDAKPSKSVGKQSKTTGSAGEESANRQIDEKSFANDIFIPHFMPKHQGKCVCGFYHEPYGCPFSAFYSKWQDSIEYTIPETEEMSSHVMVQRTQRYCFNCGRKGHSGFDCELPDFEAKFQSILNGYSRRSSYSAQLFGIDTDHEKTNYASYGSESDDSVDDSSSSSTLSPVASFTTNISGTKQKQQQQQRQRKQVLSSTTTVTTQTKTKTKTKMKNQKNKSVLDRFSASSSKQQRRQRRQRVTSRSSNSSSDGNDTDEDDEDDNNSDAFADHRYSYDSDEDFNVPYDMY